MPGPHGKDVMKCPLETREDTEILVAYSSRDAERGAIRSRWRRMCSPAPRAGSSCAGSGWCGKRWMAGKRPPVSADFDRRLYARMEREVSWWQRMRGRMGALLILPRTAGNGGGGFGGGGSAAGTAVAAQGATTAGDGAGGRAATGPGGARAGRDGSSRPVQSSDEAGEFNAEDVKWRGFYRSRVWLAWSPRAGGRNRRLPNRLKWLRRHDPVRRRREPPVLTAVAGPRQATG